MVRVFLLYNLFNSFLLCLVPKKLRVLFPPSWYIDDKNTPPSKSESPARTDHPVDLKQVFQMFDKNGDGRITKEELNDSLENLGIFMPDKDLIQMIKKMDANGDGCVDNGDGRVNYKEFLQMMKTGGFSHRSSSD